MSSEVYIPSNESLKFVAFIRAAGLEQNTSPEAHYRIGDALFSADKKDWKVLIECLRGMGKSTVVEYAVIYVAALGYWPNFGKTPFIVFLGASQEGNVKAFYKNVGSKIHNSEFLRSLFDLSDKAYRQTDSEIELTNKSGVLTISAGKGMATNWRGIRSKNGDRPTVLIADDVLSNDVMTSEAIKNTVEVNWYNSALPALDPIKHKIVYIGTPLAEDDLLHKIKNSNTYRLVRFPLCDKFPCAPEEFRSIWPDRFTYEYTKEMFSQFEAAGRTRSFYTEYMLQLTDLSTLIVDPDEIRWYDPSLLRKNKHKYNFYIVTDFATSTKKQADYSTIGVIAVSSDNSWFLVDGQCKRQTMQENLDDLFRYAAQWKPLSVGIETNGQQGGFISILEEMMMKNNVWFTLAKKKGAREKGIRASRDKLTRFVTGVAPKFAQGKIWLPKPEIVKGYSPDLLALVEELQLELGQLTLSGGVGALAHDDAVDLLNQMSEIDTITPSDDTPSPEEKLTGASARFWGSLPDEEEELEGGSTIF